MLVAMFGGITVRVIFALVTAFLVTILLTPWSTERLKRRQFGQVIREEGVATHKKKAGIPTMGGMVMLVAVLVAGGFWARWNWQTGLLGGVLVSLGLLGFRDDFLKVTRKNTKGVSSRGKLVVQCAVALALGLYLKLGSGAEPSVFLPLMGQEPEIGWLYLAWVMLVVVGASNAVNLTDGLDGLAAGIMAIVSAGFAGVSYLAGNTIFAQHLAIPYVAGAGELAVVCAAITGACLGFLWYNSHPAEVFMGDTGSLALGGAMGAVAVLVRQELLLALVGGIFVVEALSVMIQVVSFRTRGGKRVFRMAPIHHHFELCGWAEPKVVTRFWLLTLVLALCGFSLLGLHSVMHRSDVDPRSQGPATGEIGVARTAQLPAGLAASGS